MKLNKDILRQWVNLIAILTAFATNVLANIAPINDLTIGEISSRFFGEVLIIPANYAFAIWGLIYLGLISLAVYQALPSQRYQPRLQQMGYYLAIASVVQVIWVYLFQFQLFTLSMVAMLGILIPLILLYLRLEINVKKLAFSQRWLVNFPISIYLGWISVATIVNVASVLDFSNWNGWGVSPVIWTVIMMTIASVIGLILVWQRQDLAFAGVLVWALIAIVSKHSDNLTLVIAGWLLAGVLLVIGATRKIVKFKS